MYTSRTESLSSQWCNAHESELSAMRPSETFATLVAKDLASSSTPSLPDPVYQSSGRSFPIRDKVNATASREYPTRRSYSTLEPMVINKTGPVPNDDDRALAEDERGIWSDLLAVKSLV